MKQTDYHFETLRAALVKEIGVPLDVIDVMLIRTISGGRSLRLAVDGRPVTPRFWDWSVPGRPNGCSVGYSWLKSEPFDSVFSELAESIRAVLDGTSKTLALVYDHEGTHWTTPQRVIDRARSDAEEYDVKINDPQEAVAFLRDYCGIRVTLPGDSID